MHVPVYRRTRRDRAEPTLSGQPKAPHAELVLGGPHVSADTGDDRRFEHLTARPGSRGYAAPAFAWRDLFSPPLSSGRRSGAAVDVHRRLRQLGTRTSLARTIA